MLYLYMTKRVLNIKLTPKAASNRIGATKTDASGNDVLSVYVTAPPDKNKANEALLRLLAEHLGIAATRLTLLRGQTSRNKMVKVQD